MKLKNVQITNFRCFESLSLDLDSQLTVLVAKNGQGKSSLLDAIRIGLWPFVRSFDLARNPSNEIGNNISIDDIRLLKKHNGEMVRELPCRITLQGNFDLDLIENKDGRKLWTWSRYRDSEAKSSKTKENAASVLITFLANAVQNQVRNIESPDFDLPIIGYYGTGRLWNQKKLVKEKKPNADFYMSLFAYRDCLDSSSSYKYFEDWFIWIFECYWEEQIKRAERSLSPEMGSLWKNVIWIVQQAINEVLPEEMGWSDLEYSVSNEKSLVLNHPNGKLKVKQLSDGIRNTLGMVGDIAYRCIKLNWHYLHSSLETDSVINIAKETSGVVMIDEIELHLHPEWQQTVLSNLCKAFPKIQFIVTTHSPQVLSTIHRKSIRLLGKDANGKDVAVMPMAESYGELSSDVLQSIMHVNPQPPVAEKSNLDRLTALVDQGLYEMQEAKNLFAELKTVFGESHPQLQKLARSIKRQEILKA
jgi:predicted ATP-binding protein involved in virulence